MPPALLLNGRKLRTPIHNLHKWLGLTFGLLFALLGLTGSLLVFYPELDLALNPQRAVIYPSPEIPSFNRIVEALQQAEPARRNSWRIELPRGDDSPITARYYRPIETAHRAFAPLILTLDPATLQVTSQRFWGTTPSPGSTICTTAFCWKRLAKPCSASPRC